MKHTRCRPLQITSTRAAWLYTLAMATSMIINISMLHAAPCAPTKAVNVGTSAWAIADTIQGAVGGITNPFIIGSNPQIISQALVSATGGYSITNPGTYILCEDLQGQPEDAFVIAINSSNVTIDLNGHTISKAGQSTFPGSSIIFIAANGFLQNIVIKNGALNITQDGTGNGNSISAIRAAFWFGGVIKDLHIYGTSQNFDTYTQIGISLTSSQGITISNVDTAGVSNGFEYLDSNSIVTRDCKAFNSQGAGFYAHIVTINPASILIRRCSSQNSQGADAPIGGGFLLGDTLYALVDECVATGLNGNGFFSGTEFSVTFSAFDYFKNCEATNSTAAGFVSGQNTSAVGFIGCVASHMEAAGFVGLDNNPAFFRCTAHNNATFGFLQPGGIIYNCFSFNNGTDFSPATTFSSATNLGPQNFFGFMTNTVENVLNGGVINDFWPNLAT